ncbi:MAG: biotin/lipoyl-containing protein [Rhodospirillales bacterium]|jgi:acetyl-CoA carboxylase biotin carboxyl carrier protein|nr:biotin/lipoyl-containing protein [Rhodospirillales bacterium]MDP6883740.1 biotin/lipoyl-containing protein [Rhodospirillales bacterium]
MVKSPRVSDINEDLVRKLARLLEETGLSEIEYGKDGWHMRVAKASLAPAPPAVTPSPGDDVAPAADETEAWGENAEIVTSPMVGVVYNTPEPGAPPFVKVGDKVTARQTLFLIEAMKVFNPVEAPRDGTVVRIMVSNGTPVEFDEPLLVIE